MSTKALSTPISSLSQLLVQTQAARWKAAATELADRCPSIPRHSSSQVTSFMDFPVVWILINTFNSLIVFCFQLGTCVSCHQTGAECQFDRHCCAGLQCDKTGDAKIDGTCQAPRGVGMECWEDSQCASGRCSDPSAGMGSGLCYWSIGWIKLILSQGLSVRIVWNMQHTGLILGLHPANERRRYFVTTYLIGWTQARESVLKIHKLAYYGWLRN